jgi:WD40-like Beta Propeller Repeat
VTDDLEARVRDAYQSAARTVNTLQLPAPMRAAGSVPKPRNVFAPVAAAIAVLVVIGASVAVPRLLSAGNPAAAAITAPAPGHSPPFRVVVTTSDNNLASQLLVESAATGHAVRTLAPPRQGAMWIDVAATGNATRFIVAAAPASAPYTPTRLYSLTLSARGAVTGLTPLAVPTLPGEITSLAASADGRTVAYTTFGPRGGVYDVGVITGDRTRQWSVSAGAVLGMWHVSVSSDGGMLAFMTQGLGRGGNEDTAWVLPTDSAAGSITARARKVYDHTYLPGAGHAETILNSALISPDGRTLYLSTTAGPAHGTSVTRVTAVSTADGASLGTIASWDLGYPEQLSPVGGLLLSWDQDSTRAFLINPATRTRTALALRGIPRVQYATLAW